LAGLVDADHEVVDGLSGASCGAEIDVEGTAVPDADSHISIPLVTIEGSIDGVVSQVGRDSVSGGSSLEVVGVDVAV